MERRGRACSAFPWGVPKAPLPGHRPITVAWANVVHQSGTPRRCRVSKAAKAEPVEEDQAAKWVKRELLEPWVGNPRDNEKAVDPVALSIERFG